MTTGHAHTSVMVRQVLAHLSPRAGAVYADATVGAGGHTEAILEASAPDGRVIALDRDQDALRLARERLARFGARVTFAHARFSDLPRVLEQQGTVLVDGVLADIGTSSMQLDQVDRGFSFQKPGPIDMRMDTSSGETALEMIQRMTESELADVIYVYGEERQSRRIARRIKEADAAGELLTTADLRNSVHRAVGMRPGKGVDPSTRTFQALRIAVNEELDELERFVADVPNVLRDDATVFVISFHSLEDRVVKQAFRDDQRMSVVTKKPLVADEEEVASNPRARSAKGRAARRVPRIIERGETREMSSGGGL